MPYHSTPNGLPLAEPVYFHVVVNVSGAKPFEVAIGANPSFKPLQPPNSIKARITIGSSPIKMMKN